MYFAKINMYFRSTAPDFSVIRNIVFGHRDHSSGRRQLISDFCDLFV